MNVSLRLIGASVLVLALAGCAEQPYYGHTVYEGQETTSYVSPSYDTTYNSRDHQYRNDQAMASRFGVVQEVRRTNVHEARGLGAGAVVGALVGGVVGSTIGHGNGRTLATVGGAVAGGFAGQSIQNRNAENAEGYLITVRLNNGNILTIAQDTQDWIQVGQRVRIEGRGDNLRVVPE